MFHWPGAAFLLCSGLADFPGTVHCSHLTSPSERRPMHFFFLGIISPHCQYRLRRETFCLLVAVGCFRSSGPVDGCGVGGLVQLPQPVGSNTCLRSQWGTAELCEYNWPPLSPPRGSATTYSCTYSVFLVSCWIFLCFRISLTFLWDEVCI